MIPAWHSTWPYLTRPIRRWSAPEFKHYLKPGFHPNDIDQSHLIEQWQDSYPEVAALQVG